MSVVNIRSAAERIAAAEAKRTAMQKAHAEAFADQQATDLETLVDLEAEHGFERVLRIDLGGWKSGVGAATMVIVKIPDRRDTFFRRYEQSASKAKTGTTAGLDAAHALAEACLLYPNKRDQAALYEATMELAAGIQTNIAVQISKVVQGNAEEEKKS